jgi:hypothetical protein
MRGLYSYFLVILLVFTSCKKDTVDGSSMKTFQASINEMSTSLSTLEQTKFNEALYILKTFGVEGNTDIQKLEALAKLINGKKVPEIFAMADGVAQKNNVEWSSTSPPDLGNMNIFQNITATEVDPNDIKASALNILITPIDGSGASGARALRVTPRLVDEAGTPIEFSNAGLETIMEVYSNGEKLLTAKNLMSSNEFKGFYLKVDVLPADKIVDSKIDIKVSVKTTKKTHQLLKAGVLVNKESLKPEKEDTAEEKKEKEETKNSTDSETGETIENKDQNSSSPSSTTSSSPKVKPEAVVDKFLNRIGNQSLRSAYELVDNPNWGSYDKFSNPNTGFGAVKSVEVKNISVKSSSDKAASINAVYQIVDKEGKSIILNVSYGLKQVDDSWKISSYKVNSSEKK